MAMLDFTSVLTNPRLTTLFDVARREQRVDGFGTMRPSSTIFPNISGVLISDGPNDLRRTPDAEISEKTISICTRFALRGESKTDRKTGLQFQPDLVKWNGDVYIVRRVEDYSNFARGFVCAELQAIDVVNWPPNATPNQGNPN